MKKEANLISSPVLREFYNEALKNKWITEGELTKSASVSIDKYAATGNYTQDLVNLASGLRELGLYEQAESLEVKLNIFKKAQLAFSNLIDEQSRALQQAAHAESAKVVDAQGGWGVVHTNMDRQRKILETLTHQPGVSSQAPVMQNLVTAAAEALGLLKFADAAELPPRPDPEAGAGASRKIALTPEQREKAKALVAYFNTSAVAPAVSFKAAVAQAILNIESYINSLDKNFFLAAADDSQAWSDYGLFANIDSTNMISVFAAVKAITGQDFSVEGISTFIRSQNYSSLHSAMSKAKAAGILTSSNFSKYFEGTNIEDLSTGGFFEFSKEDEQQALSNMQRLGKTEFIPKTTSVWGGDIGWAGTAINEENRKIDFDSGPYIRNEIVGEAAKAVFDDMKAKLDTYFGEGPTNNKNSRMEELKKQLNELAAAADPIIALSSLKVKDLTSNFIYIKTLTDFKNKITTEIEKIKTLAAIYYAIILVRAANETRQIEKAPELIDSIITEIKTNYEITANDKEDIDKVGPSIQSSIANLTEAIRIYSSVSQMKNVDDSERERAASISTSLTGILDSIQAMQEYGISDTIVQQFLGSQGFNSFEDIANYAQQAKDTGQTEYPTKNTKSLLITNRFIKSATGPAFVGAKGGRASGSGKGVSGGAAAKPAATLTDVQKSVQNMQWVLDKLSEYVIINVKTREGASDAAILRSVGKSGSTANVQDGIWKENTRKSLETAKKYVKDISKLGPAFTNDEEKKAAAEENYTKIYNFLRNKNFSLTGAPVEAKANLIFDRISQRVQGYSTNAELLDDPDTAGDVDVTKNDLQSLASFYNFVKENLLSFNAEDVATGSDWQDLFLWFLTRAAYKIQNPGTLSKRSLYQSYDMYIKNLWQKFLILTKAKGYTLDSPEWKTLPLGPIFSSGGAGGGTLGGGGVGVLGEDEAGPGGRRRVPGRGTSGRIEETEGMGGGSDANKPPFDAKNIYLRSEFLIRSVQNRDALPDGRILSKSDLSGDPRNVAIKYFSGATPDENKIDQFFLATNPGLKVYQYDQDYFYQDPSTGKYFSIRTLKSYRNSYQQMRETGPLTSYFNMLDALQLALDPAQREYLDALEFAGGAPAEQIDRITNQMDYFSSEWIKLIRRQKERISDYFRQIM